MSSIGLYDMDFHTYIHVPFNLELMKMSSYYKGKRLLTAFSPTFEPERYSTFIVRKDYNDGIFPKELYTSSNIEIGGRAFSEHKYIPMPLEIERQYPDKNMYLKFESKFCTTNANTNLFKTMLNAEHLRLSLDGKTIWDEYKKQINITSKTHCFLFHDYDLNSINGAWEIIQELLSKQQKGVGYYIGSKFPIQLYTPDDLFKWVGISLMTNNFSIQYNGLLDDEVFCDFILQQKGTSLARQIDYVVTDGCSSEDDFIKNRLPRIFNQAIFSRINRVPISLKYANNFFFDKKWERVIDLFNAFIKNILKVKVSDEFMMWRATELETLYSFVKSFEEWHHFKTRSFTKPEVRELFQFVREIDYNLFKDFYEKSRVALKGGILVDDTRSHKKKRGSTKQNN